MSTSTSTTHGTSRPQGAQPDHSELDTLCVNTIRTLAMDAVQAANSGHPGTPMALAPVGYTLWQRHLRFDPFAHVPRAEAAAAALRARATHVDSWRTSSDESLSPGMSKVVISTHTCVSCTR